MLRCAITLIAWLLFLSSELHAQMGVVTNKSSDSVTVFNPSTGSEIRTVPVGSQPRGIVSLPNSRKALIVNELSDSISVIDTEKLMVVTTITLPVGSFLHGVIRTPDESTAMVAGQSAGQAAVFVIDTASMTLSNTLTVTGTTSGAHDLVVLPVNPLTGAGPRIYLTVPGDNLIGVIDVPSATSTTIPGGITSPRQLALHPTLPKLYVTKLDGVNSLAVLDLLTNNYTYIYFGGPYNTLDVQLTLGGLKGYCTVVPPSAGSGVVLTFDPATDSFTGSISLPYPADDLTFSPVDGRLYVGNSVPSSPGMLAIDTGTNSFVGSLTSGGASPRRVAYVPSNPPPYFGYICPIAVQASLEESVTVYGSNFVPGFNVRVGPQASPMVEYISSNEIRFIAPALPAGTYSIGVINPDLQAAIAPAVLTYATPVIRTCLVPPGTEPWEYRMVTPPLFMRGPIFKNAMIAALGPYDPTIWRAFHWEAKFNRYTEFNEADFNSFCDNFVGESFWILSRNGAILDFPGLNTLDATADIIVRLEPGWSQIGSPAGSIDWSTVRAGPMGGTAVQVGSPANTYVTPAVFTFVDGSYYAVTTLEPKRGYWVKNLTPDMVLLRMPVTTLAKSSQESGALLPLRASDDPPPPPPGSYTPANEGGGRGGGGGGCYVTSAWNDISSDPRMLPLFFLFFFLTAGIILRDRIHSARQK